MGSYVLYVIHLLAKKIRTGNDHCAVALTMCAHCLNQGNIYFIFNIIISVCNFKPSVPLHTGAGQGLVVEAPIKGDQFNVYIHIAIYNIYNPMVKEKCNVGCVKKMAIKSQIPISNQNERQIKREEKKRKRRRPEHIHIFL